MKAFNAKVNIQMICYHKGRHSWTEKKKAETQEAERQNGKSYNGFGNQ